MRQLLEWGNYWKDYNIVLIASLKNFIFEAIIDVRQLLMWGYLSWKPGTEFVTEIVYILLLLSMKRTE